MKAAKLFLVLIVTLSLFLTSVAAETTVIPKVETLSHSCMFNGEECELLENQTVGICRQLSFAVNDGEAQVEVCHKDGNRYELYRQMFPNHGNMEICVGAGCVDNNLKGYDSFTSDNLPAVEEGYLFRNLEDFQTSCTSENGECTKVNDTVNGVCRSVDYEVDGQSIETLACHKGNSRYEYYRSAAPEGVPFRACFGSMCVDELQGYDSQVITDANGMVDNGDNETDNGMQNETNGQDDQEEQGFREMVLNMLNTILQKLTNVEERLTNIEQSLADEEVEEVEEEEEQEETEEQVENETEEENATEETTEEKNNETEEQEATEENVEETEEENGAEDNGQQQEQATETEDEEVEESEETVPENGTEESTEEQNNGTEKQEATEDNVEETEEENGAEENEQQQETTEENSTVDNGETEEDETNGTEGEEEQEQTQ